MNYRVLVISLAFGVGMAGWNARPVEAEHFDISLLVQTSKGRAESGWDTHPPEGGLNPRPSVSAAVGEEFPIEWRMESEFPHGIMRDVTIRLYLVPEAEIGQKEVPPPSVPRLLDNSFKADFLPHHRARGHVMFRPMKPGNYLIRLDSEFTLKEHGHEHFGAVDLHVE